MQEYANRQELIDEIKKCAMMFIGEFNSIDNTDRDLMLEGVERTPSQMIAYQLGWMNLLLSWEREEQAGKVVVTPAPEYKWNNLGGLYKSFYNEYSKFSLGELINKFNDTAEKIIVLIEGYSDEELFQAGGRKWSSSTPSNWPIWKWIHINTVAPFKTFRAKVRKWKKLRAN